MASDKDWFIRERSEALASWLLTSRNDAHVRKEQVREDGADLLVEIDRGEPLSTRVFLVQVKGTLSSDRNQWIDSLQSLFQVSPRSIFLPACVFVVNVRDNRAHYAWIVEPRVQDQGAKLHLLPPGEFHDLNPSAVDEIVNRVQAWYDALPRQLVPERS